MKGFTVEDFIAMLEKVEDKKMSITAIMQVDSLTMSGLVVGVDEGKNSVALKIKDATLKNL